MSRQVFWIAIAATALAAWGGACTGSKSLYIPPPEIRQKVGFSFSELDREGLTTSPAGRIPIHYEFCIPDLDSCRAKVRQTDPTVQFHDSSPGRIGCKVGPQVLAIGHTNQENYRDVVYELAAFTFIERIERTYFE